jgi:DNA-binding CsgD family transcriptional regulator
VAQGRTDGQVADQLFLSAHTVNAHLRQAFTKLDVNSRIKLARLAAQHEPRTGQAPCEPAIWSRPS